MAGEPDHSRYYVRGDLLARLEAALRDDGADPERPTPEALAPYDHFHGRGLEATRDAAALMPAVAPASLLDIGSGIGGPARYFAQHFGCRVTGIDLTPEFCAVARHLTRLMGMEDRVRFEVGNALAMPFADASFDGACSMNVAMNIADKRAFYREIRRVLRPGAWLVLSELAQGPGGAPDYPTPWAETAASSFLATPEETRRGLEEAGFEVVRLHDSAAEAKAFAARARVAVESGGKPPYRAVFLIHADIAARAIANTGRAFAEGRLIPIEILCRSRHNGITGTGNLTHSMNTTSERPDLPDRLSVDPHSPHYVAAVLEHDIGIRLNDQERKDVEEYCLSEGWVKVPVGKKVDRKGQPLLIKLRGKVEAFYK